MRLLRRLGAVQMTTAATAGNLTTVLLALVDGVRGRPLVPWSWFMGRYLGWHA